MTQSAALRPPIDPAETETITFDYSPELGNDTIENVLSIKVAVVIGDGPVDNIIKGNPQISTSKASGLAAQAVLVQIHNCIAGNTYQFQCLVFTSAGDSLMLRGNLPCAVVPDAM